MSRSTGIKFVIQRVTGRGGPQVYESRTCNTQCQSTPARQSDVLYLCLISSTVEFPVLVAPFCPQIEHEKECVSYKGTGSHVNWTSVPQKRTSQMLRCVFHGTVRHFAQELCAVGEPAVVLTRVDGLPRLGARAVRLNHLEQHGVVLQRLRVVNCDGNESN